MHTPGPWEVTKEGAVIGSHSNHDLGLHIATVDFPQHDAWGNPIEIHNPQQVKDANSRLIAAAPDLLALAAEFEAFAEASVMDAIEYGDLMDLATWMPRLRHARAAIDKATGPRNWDLPTF